MVFVGLVFIFFRLGSFGGGDEGGGGFGSSMAVVGEIVKFGVGVTDVSIFRPTIPKQPHLHNIPL